MKKLHVLHLEDDESDAFFIRQELEDQGIDADFVVACTRDEFLAELNRGRVDLILSDHGLPGFSGNVALEIAREKHPGIPFIFVSGMSDEREIARGLKAGAAAYVLKGCPGELVDAVRKSISKAEGDSGKELLERHNRAMKCLVTAVQELSLARSIDEITAVVRKAARELTGADGATFVLRDGEKCYYADEDAIEPLWKGQRFPLSACISGWSMFNKQPAIIEDIYADDRIPHDAYRPTFVKSLVMVPIRESAPIGAIGNYWAHRHLATPEEVELLQALANTTSVAMENAEIHRELEQRVKDRTVQLEAANRELESFSFSVSHDLQAPLRRLEGYATLVRRQLGASLEGKALQYFGNILSEKKRMTELVEDLLRLAGIARAALHWEKVDLSAIALELAAKLGAPGRNSDISIQNGLEATGDTGLLRIVLENLLSNAWKYSSKGRQSVIEFGSIVRDGSPVFFVRDNGVGFDMNMAGRLFAPFQRLHRQEDFAGTGVGLATVQRIIHRHGGTIRAESKPDEGATFYFTLPPRAAVDF